MTLNELTAALNTAQTDIADTIFTNVDGYTPEDIGAETEDEAYIDVRLQVSERGLWSVHTGDSSYDQDHRGYWGTSSIAIPATREAASELAAELIDQACDDFAQSGEAE